jgi:predicted NBD/HSP70 family sugar kinase
MTFARPSEMWAQAAHNWTARSLCDEFSSRLAQAVGVAASLLNPSRVVIAGSMGEDVMRGLSNEVALRLSGFCPPALCDGLQVLGPHFGADAAVMGSVAFAVDGRQ